MSDSSQQPWSNNLNAPQIPYRLYLGEKENFAGNIVGAVLYGVITILFFQCVAGLLNPVGRTRGNIKWGLVAHTVAMFSFSTIYTAMNLDIQSLSSIDNREFPGDGASPPGPLGYQFLINSNVITIAPDILIFLNGWLADGLLLYRCYIIYAMNRWIVAFPCLMYLASWATGIAIIYYQASQPLSAIENSAIPNFGYPYYSISFSLNAILTLMIIVRLVLHSRNIRNAMGIAAGALGLHKAIITMLVESAALYAVTYLIFIGTWASSNAAQFIFLPALAQIQVIAPFLIVLRVANQRALTSGTIASGNIGSIHFRSEGKSTVGANTFPDGNPGSSMEASGETFGKHGARNETASIEEVPL